MLMRRQCSHFLEERFASKRQKNGFILCIMIIMYQYQTMGLKYYFMIQINLYFIYILYILHIYQDGTLKLVLRAKLFKNENKKLKNRANRL